MSLDSKKLLLCLSYKYKGDWENIYKAIKIKEYIKEEEVEKAVNITKANYITILEEEYPEHLRQCPKPPFVLYYYGDISLISDRKKVLGIIGSYTPSTTIKIFVKEVIENSNNIIFMSNLGYGINVNSIDYALKSGKKIILVLPTGIDRIYPEQFLDIFEKVKKQGLIISEFPLDYFPDEQGLKMSNRLISSLSKGIWIPEVDEKTPHNALYNLACVTNGGLYACPHDIRSNDTKSNDLIKAGATIVTNRDDIYDDFR